MYIRGSVCQILNTPFKHNINQQTKKVNLMTVIILMYYTA
jgi:hypothetical protein